MNLVLILGAQGVGKTSVVEEAVERIEEEYQVLNFGSVLQEVIKGEDRDEFRRKVPVSQYQKIQKKAAKKVKRKTESENVIITSHGVLYKKAGWYPGFPREILDILKPKMIVVLEAEPENIIKRRQKGGSERRTRDRTPKGVVKEEQDTTRYISFAYSMYAGATVRLIENREGKLKETAEKLAEALKNFQ